MTIEADAQFFGNEARIWDDAGMDLDAGGSGVAPTTSGWPSIFSGSLGSSDWKEHAELVSAVGWALRDAGDMAHNTANQLRASGRDYLENENLSVDEIQRLCNEYGL